MESDIFIIQEINQLDELEMAAIRGGDGPEIDPDPEPIIVTEDG